MTYQFKKHYTVDEARALLPSVRRWLERLDKLRRQILRCEKRMTGLMVPGADLGGDLVNEWVRALASMREVLLEFFRRDLQIKDLERGLIDFPAILEGREVFLCWEKGEEDIEFWHDLEAGFSGREPI